MEARAYLVIIILVFRVVELAPLTCLGSKDFAFRNYKMELRRLSLQVVNREDHKRSLPAPEGYSPPQVNAHFHHYIPRKDFPPPEGWN
ncbi:conserved hypothetical protein [Ricinus communis]|uniref:Uncharacterized protein n=1 Tax=Ricinus communis TaxID=3988 RepID=B9S7J7_RICCO|nr:conserved hypothetical protein [Ricinus communis]